MANPIAKVGDKFTESIETENRNRFFRRNLGYVLAGLAMTAARHCGVITFGGLQDQDFAILCRYCVWRRSWWSILAFRRPQSLFPGDQIQCVDPWGHVDRIFWRFLFRLRNRC